MMPRLLHPFSSIIFSSRAELTVLVYTNRPTLSLFMWESGSYFDGLCNKIQNDPAAVVPTQVLRGLMTGMGVGNGTVGF